MVNVIIIISEIIINQVTKMPELRHELNVIVTNLK